MSHSLTTIRVYDCLVTHGEVSELTNTFDSHQKTFGKKLVHFNFKSILLERGRERERARETEIGEELNFCAF